MKTALGVALLVAATGILLRPVIQRRRQAQTDDGMSPPVRRGLTIAVGAVGGLIVGMTSVGSGSLIIVMLLFVYPTLRPAELVGTDLIQAIPLVALAALGHVLFGDVRLGLTLSLVVGALPGVYIGARMSSRAPDRVIRPALITVLVASGLKLVGAF